MVEVNFGVGYGPVSLNYEDVETVDGFTLDWLVAKFAALPEDNDEWFPFFAYCRNAGHIVDDYEANRIWGKFDDMYVRYHTVSNWASPITFLEVSPDAPAGELQKALDTIIEFADGSADYAREESQTWQNFVTYASANANTLVGFTWWAGGYPGWSGATTAASGWCLKWAICPAMPAIASSRR